MQSPMETESFDETVDMETETINNSLTGHKSLRTLRFDIQLPETRNDCVAKRAGKRQRAEFADLFAWQTKGYRLSSMTENSSDLQDHEKSFNEDDNSVPQFGPKKFQKSSFRNRFVSEDSNMIESFKFFAYVKSKQSQNTWEIMNSKENYMIQSSGQFLNKYAVQNNNFSKDKNKHDSKNDDSFSIIKVDSREQKDKKQTVGDHTDQIILNDIIMKSPEKMLCQDNIEETVSKTKGANWKSFNTLTENERISILKIGCREQKDQELTVRDHTDQIILNDVIMQSPEIISCQDNIEEIVSKTKGANRKSFNTLAENERISILKIDCREQRDQELTVRDNTDQIILNDVIIQSPEIISCQDNIEETVSKTKRVKRKRCNTLAENEKIREMSGSHDETQQLKRVKTVTARKNRPPVSVVIPRRSSRISRKPKRF